jgi:hypothetical protein
MVPVLSFTTILATVSGIMDIPSTDAMKAVGDET